MRFGWLVAAIAATVAGVCQADAQTFTQYRITGHGTIQSTNAMYQSVGSPNQQDFTAIFSLVATPGMIFSNGMFASDGNTYNGSSAFYNSSANGALSGQLRYNDSIVSPMNSMISNLTLSYADTDSLGGLPLALASPSAAGTFTYNVSNMYAGGYTFTGNISSLAIVGTSSTNTPLFASFVPEPATWLMLILGLGAVGVVLRRRSRSLATA